MDTVKRKPSAALPEFALPEEELRRQLVADSNRESLEAYLGAVDYRELQRLAAQAEQNRVRAHAGPRVYLLPGIMGSRLGVPASDKASKRTADEVVWIDPDAIGRGRLTRLALPRGGRLQALGAMVLIYLKLKLRLELAGFDVRFHAYDWRQSLETLGTELLQRLRRDRSEKILLVAHSMGGLVCRMAMGLETEDRHKNKIGRLVMIGTPNFGSFAPVLALRGVYPAVRKVATLDPKNSPEKLAVRVFNTLPGLQHMLPAREVCDEFNLYDPENWPDDDMRPRRSILEDIPRIRGLLAPPDERFFSIAGVNQETVTRLERIGNSFEYLSTCEGDGTVPVASAVLAGVPTYYVEEIHPALPTNQAVAAAAIDLLERGTTSRLPQVWRRKHAATHRIEEEKLRLPDKEKKTWHAMTMEERRALLTGLALPI